MPNAKVLESKKAVVETLSAKIKEATSVVFVDYKGINVAQDTALRQQFREAGVEYTVVKNTLIKLAIQGTALESMSEVLDGTSAIATCKDDYVAAARILNKYAEDHENFNLKTGYIDGEVISMDKLMELATLPSRETLLSMVANVFSAPIAGFARAVQAIADKAEAPAEA